LNFSSAQTRQQRPVPDRVTHCSKVGQGHQSLKILNGCPVNTKQLDQWSDNLICLKHNTPVTTNQEIHSLLEAVSSLKTSIVKAKQIVNDNKKTINIMVYLRTVKK